MDALPLIVFDGNLAKPPLKLTHCGLVMLVMPYGDKDLDQH